MPSGGHTVTMLPVGRSQVPGPEAYWMAGWDTWVDLEFQVGLIRGGDVCCLVNTGPPDDLTQLNATWQRLLGARAVLRRRPEDGVVARLAQVGVAPEDVTHIVLTPLQLYTTGNVHRFPNATICLAERGWVHFHVTHRHPHDLRWSTFAPATLVHLMVDAWDRVRLLGDEGELAPGLRAWWAGAHHRATLVVEADTARGTVALSDAFFTYRNLEDDHPIGICESLEEATRAYARVRSTADLVVPLYDPEVFVRHPGGVVAGE